MVLGEVVDQDGERVEDEVVGGILVPLLLLEMGQQDFEELYQIGVDHLGGVPLDHVQNFSCERQEVVLDSLGLKSE